MGICIGKMVKLIKKRNKKEPEKMQKGKASLLFEHPAYITGMASVAGKKEG